jgi:hypothetical protein
MNSKATAIWFVIAAALFASCLFLVRHFRPADTTSPQVLGHFVAANVTSIQVDPAGAPEIRAVRTNNSWQLLKPVSYPGQQRAINALLEAFQGLTPVLRIQASELHQNHVTDADYGFDTPRFSIVINEGDERQQLQIGNPTALRDQVYVRVVGVDGAYVTDASWLDLLPRTGDNWRDTSLVAATTAIDWIVLTNGTRSIELRRDPKTQLWRMLFPLVARADSAFIDQSLLKLQAAQISQFVSPDVDNPTYGLQPPSLDLWLGSGTNFLTSLHVGKTATNDPAADYIERDSLNSVALTSKESLSPWRKQVNDFRDRQLLELTQPVTSIDVDAVETFTLQRFGSNQWSVVGQKYPADTGTVTEFLKILAGMKVTKFVKDVVTPEIFQSYGLTTNSHQITLHSTVDGTNTVLAQIIFGNVDTNGVYVRRADEGFVYRVSLADANQLLDHAFQFRERQIWNFTGRDVAQVTLRQNGKVRQIIHNGPGQWTLAAGSQGMIAERYIEESIGGAQNEPGLCQLSAWLWERPNVTDADAQTIYGFNTNNLQITVDLKNGEKHTVDFGSEITARHTALASVMLDGQRWVFWFPPVLYQFVYYYLTIPADQP